MKKNMLFSANLPPNKRVHDYGDLAKAGVGKKQQKQQRERGKVKTKWKEYQ